ncbi:MAG: hypothetical protein IPM59_00575 [Chloracidobacterium sp.]|nr:hypothetical protein [Chloracidobacterium sp.]
MDNELDGVTSSSVRGHLALCEECGRHCTDQAALLQAAADKLIDDLPPNESKHMWLRIHNVIEAETKAATPTEPERHGRWRFSWLRLSAAMVSIALVSSLLTVVVLRRYDAPLSADDVAARAATKPSVFEKLLSTVGLIKTPQQDREQRIREQQAAIDYWNTRVQVRRQQWDARTREAFDRNLRVIDESLAEYSTILARDPDDELSGEMFDSVLHEKMDLLRDFSDL